MTTFAKNHENIPAKEVQNRFIDSLSTPKPAFGNAQVPTLKGVTVEYVKMVQDAFKLPTREDAEKLILLRNEIEIIDKGYAKCKRGSGVGINPTVENVVLQVDLMKRKRENESQSLASRYG